MLDPTIAFDLIGQIYDAAVAPDLWRVFLEALAAAVGGGAAHIVLSFPQQGEVGFVAESSWHGEAANREYAEFFYAHDPWVQRSPAVPWPLGVAIDWGAFEPPEHTRRTLFWNDFLRRHGIGYEPPLGMILRREGSHWAGSCSVHPLEGQRPYGAEEGRLMGILGPHLLRAVRIHQLLSEHQLARGAKAEALDRIPLGVLLVDATGRIVRANIVAQRLLAEGDGLLTDGRRLAGANPAVTHELERLIGRAAEAVSDPASHLEPGMGGVLSAPRPSPRRALEILVCPARTGAAGWTTRRPMATVFVSDPEQRLEAPTERLRRLYDLTPAEAALAAKLGAGDTLDEIAEALNLTRNTARFYLKRVFAKTGTSRQAELVRLLTTGIARVGLDEEPTDQT